MQDSETTSNAESTSKVLAISKVTGRTFNNPSEWIQHITGVYKVGRYVDLDGQYYVVKKLVRSPSGKHGATKFLCLLQGDHGEHVRIFSCKDTKILSIEETQQIYGPIGLTYK